MARRGEVTSTLPILGSGCGPYFFVVNPAAPILDLAWVVTSTLNPVGKISVRQKHDLALGIQHVPSTARARRELGLAQTVSIEDAIGKTIAWHGFGQS